MSRRPPRKGPRPAARVEADAADPLVLAVDASGPVEALALAQGSIVLAAWSARRPRGRGTALAARIRELLTAAARAPEDLAALSVVVGPGSFTGLRVGLSTVQGMAAGLGIPAFPEDATRAWALGLRGGDRPVAVTLDARRGEVYGALWSVPAEGRAEQALPLRLCAPEAWASELADRGSILVGDGAALYRERFAGIPFVDPGGPALGAVARELAEALIAEPDRRPAPLRPLYLRDHDAARK